MTVKLLRVNEAARELGISESWLRRAEQRSRIPRARRDVNGWRIYTEKDVEVLRELLFPIGSEDISSGPEILSSPGQLPGEKLNASLE